MTAHTHTRRRTLQRLACAALAMMLGLAQAAPPPLSEHAVKAAVLFRAAKFIEWPESSFANTNDAFVMCVVGVNGPSRDFDALQNKQINSHPVTVRRITGDMLDLRQCHAAFFPSNGSADVDYALGKLEGAPVLTVGETEDFAQRGGALALVTVDQRVRFLVNIHTSKRAGLNVSAQLLLLSTVVGEPRP